MKIGLKTLGGNLTAILIVIGIVILSVALHSAGEYIGSLEMPRVFGDYGQSEFRLGSTEYPRTSTDAEGYKLTIAKPARRVASLSWAIDEFVYSVVPPENVVAVSDSAYDRDYSNVYGLAEQFRPAVAANAEVVLKLGPDLAINTSRTEGDLTNILQIAGVPVFRMFTLFTTLDEVKQTILLTGYLSGEDVRARKEYERFESAIQRARNRKPTGVSAPRILGYHLGRSSYGDQTLFHDIVRTVGGINIGAEHGLRGYDAVSTEQIIRWDPEWIVTGSALGRSAEMLNLMLQDPAISLTTAARKGQILVFDSNVFIPMSPFTSLMLEALGESLYGPDPNQP